MVLLQKQVAIVKKTNIITFDRIREIIQWDHNITQNKSKKDAFSVLWSFQNVEIWKVKTTIQEGITTNESGCEINVCKYCYTVNVKILVTRCEIIVVPGLHTPWHWEQLYHACWGTHRDVLWSLCQGPRALQHLQHTVKSLIHHNIIITLNGHISCKGKKSSKNRTFLWHIYFKPMTSDIVWWCVNDVTWSSVYLNIYIFLNWTHFTLLWLYTLKLDQMTSSFTIYVFSC